MTWKRAGTWGLWVILAIVPGGLGALAILASVRALRARLPAQATPSATPLAR
jgi:hypothetical protein